MKLVFILAALFLSTITYGQRDFNYSVVTSNLMIGEKLDSTTSISLFCNIEKRGDELRIYRIFNVSEVDVFRIRFIGWDSKLGRLMYKIIGSKEGTFWCNPLKPEAQVTISGKTIRYY